MKKLFPFVIFLLASSLVHAIEIPDYVAEKIAPHTYVIHGPKGVPSPENKGFMNNPVFVITETGVVVIDPGSSVYTGRMVLRQIRKLSNKRVTHVLNTHIHGDHWLGNQAFAEVYPHAQIMAHPDMIAQAKAGADQFWIGMMSDLTRGATDGTRAIIPTKAVDEAHEFKTGGLTFRILAPRQAHSGTDIMIHILEDSVLLAGDNVFHQRIGRMDDATFRGNINACDVASKSGAKVFVPGHGPTGDITVVKEFRNYMSTLYESVKELYDEGLTDYQMKPKVVARLKAYHKWDGFEHEVGKHISLALLEAEKAIFE